MSDATDNRFYREAQPASKEIVRGLRAAASEGYRICGEAADEIERLRGELTLALAHLQVETSKRATCTDCLSTETDEWLIVHREGCSAAFQHGGRPMTLRECMDADDGAESKVDDETVILRRLLGAAAQRIQELERTDHEPLSEQADDMDESGRNGHFENCGYVGTASGFIVRDGTYWIATFRTGAEADQYVELRNGDASAQPPGREQACEYSDDGEHECKHCDAKHYTQSAESFIETIWEVTDDCEENAQTGDVTMDHDSWEKIMRAIWDLGGRHRERLADFGYSPETKGGEQPWR